MRLMLFLSFAFLNIAALTAQCYEPLRQAGIECYNRGDYKGAKQKFESAKDCSDRSADQDLDAWVQKTQTKMNAAKRQRDEESERQRKAAAQRQRDQAEAEDQRQRNAVATEQRRQREAAEAEHQRLELEKKVCAAAIDSAIWVIRVDYVLEEVQSILQGKTKGKKEAAKQFGKNGKEFFGRVHGIAVLTDSRLWVDSHLLEPWKYADSLSYSLVKDENKYTPIISHIWLRRMRDKKFNEYKLDSAHKIIAKQEAAIVPLRFETCGWGLESQWPKPNTDTSGFILLLSATSKDIDADMTNFGLEMPNNQIIYNNQGTGFYKISPTSRYGLHPPPFAGAYFTLRHSLEGVQCFFSGILVRSKTDGFTLLPMATIPMPSKK